MTEMTEDRANTLVSQYLKLETVAQELTEEQANDQDTIDLINAKARKIEELEYDIQELTQEAIMKAKELKNQQKAILDELAKMYSEDTPKEVKVDNGTIQYRITKTTVIHDKTGVVDCLVKNNKVKEGIKTFDMKLIRSFIETGLLDEVAGFEEKINVKIIEKEKEE